MTTTTLRWGLFDWLARLRAMLRTGRPTAPKDGNRAVWHRRYFASWRDRWKDTDEPDRHQWNKLTGLPESTKDWTVKHYRDAILVLLAKPLDELTTACMTRSIDHHELIRVCFADRIALDADILGIDPEDCPPRLVDVQALVRAVAELPEGP